MLPVDPMDPFRGAYVRLDYPDLQPHDEPLAQPGMHDGDEDQDERGALYVTLRREGEVWVAADWVRDRPDEGPYLACDDREWRLRCGIESWFLPQDDATAMEGNLADGAIATVKVDGRGHAAVVDVR